MSEANKMPARIWCDSIDADVCRMRFRPSDTVYIRADIAEQMAEALRGVLGCAHSTTPEMTHALVNADAALTSWEASNA